MHNLTEQTAARFRADGATARREGAAPDPDTRALVQQAQADIPPGFREDGPTIRAIREQWHQGYTLGYTEGYTEQVRGTC